MAKESFQDASGELVIEIARPDLIVQRFKGRLLLPMCAHVRKPVDEALARGGQPDTFYDWYEMASYDTQARDHLTQWTRSIAKKLRSHHILTHSSITAMGVRVANILLGGSIKVYSHREDFERALAKTTGQQQTVG